MKTLAITTVMILSLCGCSTKTLYVEKECPKMTEIVMPNPVTIRIYKDDVELYKAHINEYKTKIKNTNLKIRKMNGWHTRDER